FGMFGRTGTANAQCELLTLGFEPCAVWVSDAADPGQSVPWSIQARKRPTCSAESRGPVRGITKSFLAPATSWINLLPALSPGLITAPEFPPAIAPARESNRSPPDCADEPWQFWQRSLRIGS